MVDAAIGRTNTDLLGTPDISLWEPIADPKITGVDPVYGPNALLNGTAEAGLNIFPWTSAESENPEYENGLISTSTLGPLDTTTSSPLAGTRSFRSLMPYLGDGASNLMDGVTFHAGRTYRLSLRIRALQTPEQILLAFGASSPSYIPPGYFAARHFPHDRVTAVIDLATSQATYELFWTPTFDTQRAYVALTSNQNNNGATRYVIFDDVTVQEVIGYKIVGGTDFEQVTVKLPGLFSPRHATPYRIRALSGTLRPAGLRRDPIATVDHRNDFNTALRALGNLRNASSGELEFRPDQSPPTIYHHQRRGKDHSKLENGLDLRFQKGVVSRRRSRDSTNVTNRLIVVGYGSDRTQLVTELRSLRDINGRVPSDPNYRRDQNGRYPANAVEERNTIRNPRLLNDATTWQGSATTAQWDTQNVQGRAAMPDNPADFGWRVQGTKAANGTQATIGPQPALPVGAFPEVLAGVPNMLSADVYPIDGPANQGYRFNVTYYDSANASISSLNTAVVPIANVPLNARTRISASITPPAGTVRIRPTLQIITSISGDTVDVYLTRFRVAYASESTAYLDGSLGNYYAWTGAPHASVSYKLSDGAGWDKYSGGTSEEIYGKRYGVYRDSNLTTLYAAQEVGQGIVELSAFPAVTYEITLTDLDEQPKNIDPGDTVVHRVDGRDSIRRIIEITNDIEKPRELMLVIGDAADEQAKRLERITKDVDTVLSFLSER